MDRDGTKDGFDLALTRAVSTAVRVPVVASGGCGSVAHMADALTEGGASAALAASVFHFGEIRIPEAKAELLRAGVPVRPAAGAAPLMAPAMPQGTRLRRERASCPWSRRTARAATC